MPNTSGKEPSHKPLRLWPGIVAVAVQWLGMFVVPSLAPDIGMTAFVAGIAGGLGVLLWWLFLSRAAWVERLGGLALMAAGVFAASRLVHESVSNGMQGAMPVIYALPALSIALVAWGVASRRLSTGPRRVALAAAILLACGALTLVRTEGIIGGVRSELRWRWTPTAEELLLARAGDEPRVLPRLRPTPGHPTHKHPKPAVSRQTRRTGRPSQPSKRRAPATRNRRRLRLCRATRRGPASAVPSATAPSTVS